MEKQNVCAVGVRTGDRDDLLYSKCDKYDYLTAVGCGAVAGLVDIFLVGSSLDLKNGSGSVLGK